MLTNILGYPRMGAHRELKRAVEAYWKGQSDRSSLLQTAAQIRKENWQLMKDEGIDLIPSADFSLYDHVLSTCLMFGAIPARYDALRSDKLDLFFAMAHGKQSDGVDVIAMEMTKWFDTNYHYIVPEFDANTKFSLFDNFVADAYKEALALGIKTKPVILGPATFLLLGKIRNSEISLSALADKLIPVYNQLLDSLADLGADFVQIDEPLLVTDLDQQAKELFSHIYKGLTSRKRLKVILATYFDGIYDNAPLAASLGADFIHVDLVAAPDQLDAVIAALPSSTGLSVGIVEGRNIWKNDFDKSLDLLKDIESRLGSDRVIVSTSCSLLHSPQDLDNETNEKTLPAEVKRWMAYAKQKVTEVATIADLASANPSAKARAALAANQADVQSRLSSPLVHKPTVKARAASISSSMLSRPAAYAQRTIEQRKKLGLPLLPTTTIGSFPQTAEVRQWRSRFKKGEVTREQYDNFIKSQIAHLVKFQEELGLDVLVHGEFERNDMVEYFGEQLEGFAFSSNGWVQSYGSRCVKPPVIYGDVARPNPMTVNWITYAQSLTSKPMKGMLTGPVTIQKWSFVRNDQPLADTCRQIALAIRDEVLDLEKAGIGVIQIDEAAFREGSPIRKAKQPYYYQWAVDSFRITSSGVKNETQIHTHMCYSEFNGIMEHIAAMDADAITIECSRSQMELLDAFVKYHYPNEVGPGVYDIHSARVPSVDEIVNLLNKALRLIPRERLWVNPDCGLKTRQWPETEASLRNMVKARDIVVAQA